jgi:hypothetical protein
MAAEFERTKENSSPVKNLCTWQMLRSRPLEKLTQLLHQLSRINVFQRAEFRAFLCSCSLVHIERGGIVPFVQNRLRLVVKRCVMSSIGPRLGSGGDMAAPQIFGQAVQNLFDVGTSARYRRAAERTGEITVLAMCRAASAKSKRQSALGGIGWSFASRRVRRRRRVWSSLQYRLVADRRSAKPVKRLEFSSTTSAPQEAAFSATSRGHAPIQGCRCYQDPPRTPEFYLVICQCRFRGHEDAGTHCGR